MQGDLESFLVKCSQIPCVYHVPLCSVVLNMR